MTATAKNKIQLKVIAFIVILAHSVAAFFTCSIQSYAHANVAAELSSYANLSYLPIPGQRISLSPAFSPALIKGIKIFPDNPLRFNFIVDVGDSGLGKDELNKEANKLIKYFLASLTVPEKDFWVNLSPYEKDKVIPEVFGSTEMGVDLLAQDYLLKQITSSLMYPESIFGENFWNNVYDKAYKEYGTIDIPLNTFNKIWILPEKIIIYENADSAFVVESKLKVMLEEDYLAMNSVGTGAPIRSKVSNPGEDMGLVTDVIREIIIPAIEHEVNYGKNFSNTRQILHSLALATWFKRNLKESLLGQFYVGKNKIDGIDIEDKDLKLKIYNQYLKALKKGVFNYIKEEFDPNSQNIIPRKYFSGGAYLLDIDKAMLTTDSLEGKSAAEENLSENGTFIFVTDLVSSDPQQALNIANSTPIESTDTYLSIFAPYRGKKIIVADDKEIFRQNTKQMLEQYFDSIAVASSPEEVRNLVESLKLAGTATEDIIILSDFQFEGEKTVIPLINWLRGLDTSRTLFKGQILLISGSIITQNQLPGYNHATKDINADVKTAYGLEYLEKNGHIGFREELKNKLLSMLRSRPNLNNLTDQLLKVKESDSLAYPQGITYFMGGVNDFENHIGRKVIDLNEYLLANKGNIPEDILEQLNSNIIQLLSLAEFSKTKYGPDGLELSFARRVHDYKGSLHYASSGVLRNIIDIIEASAHEVGVSATGKDILRSIASIDTAITAAREYAAFLHSMFYHMQGLHKTALFEPLLQGAIVEYQRVVDGKTDTIFNPYEGISSTLDHLNEANDKYQMGQLEDSMLEWGRLFNVYKSLQEKKTFDEILLSSDKSKSLFLDVFARHLNNFFGQYLQQFGNVNLNSLNNGNIVGRIHVIDPGQDEEAVLELLRNVVESDIVVLEQNYSRLSIAATKAGGFIFSREGGEHIATMATALAIPLVTLPNAVEYFQKYHGEWIVLEGNKDGTGGIRFANQDQINSRKVLRRSAKVVKPAEISHEGPMVVSLDGSLGDPSLEFTRKIMGEKIAKQYFIEYKGEPVPSFSVLTCSFFKNLLDANSGAEEQIQVLYNQMEKSNGSSIKKALSEIRGIIKSLNIPEKLRELVKNSLPDAERIIFRLSTNAEDMDEEPGVGTGVYGSKENILVPKEEENWDSFFESMLDMYATIASEKAFSNRELFNIHHLEVEPAMQLQAYYAEKIKYSFIIRTVDPKSKNTDIMEILVMPGGGRSLSSPNEKLQGEPYRFFYDKITKHIITPDDPRTQFHPQKATKTHIVSAMNGEIVVFDATENIFETILKVHRNDIMRIVESSTRIEELFKKAQEIEGVIYDDSGFDFVQSKTQGNVPSFSIKTEYDKFKQKTIPILREFLTLDISNLQDLGFYEDLFNDDFDGDFDGDLRNKFKTSSAQILGAFNMQAYDFKNFTFLLKLLIEEEVFSHIKEGIIRRIFFYAVGRHEDFIGFLQELYAKNSDLFFQVFEYAVPYVYPEKEGDFGGGEFLQSNDYLILRFLDRLTEASLGIVNK